MRTLTVKNLLGNPALADTCMGQNPFAKITASDDAHVQEDYRTCSSYINRIIRKDQTAEAKYIIKQKLDQLRQLRSKFDRLSTYLYHRFSSKFTNDVQTRPWTIWTIADRSHNQDRDSSAVAASKLFKHIATQVVGQWSCSKFELEYCHIFEVSMKQRTEQIIKEFGFSAVLCNRKRKRANQ
ncbi:hypothetical protein G6F70_000744 [Rhizopus microsporus]|nr:hypothetical protein G6F71_007432 [Rhizopus microsporus]KAG1204173.1 hypothetical protein G6F70_000744 [Rhizopus microsporus]KAG1211090.1 hypothetical protein G6F69_004905 [Rhizopus microsporus]KAG1232950.1 hypothetical protein G6F67_004643 [Rhizopus microsporus]KAG1265012.1 hypothetical protein G6F68_003919 [Rhizopus microsporus]